MSCIYCQGKIVKYGVYNGTNQRYKCLKCSRTFSERTISRTHSQKDIRLVLHLMLAGCNKSEIAAELKMEEKSIEKWINRYYKNIFEIVPKQSLLAIKTL